MSITLQPPQAKKLRKKNGKAVEQPSSQPASASVSSSIDYLSESSIKESGKKVKNPKKQQQQGSQQQGTQQHRSLPSSSTTTSRYTSQLTKPLLHSITSIKTDGYWTRVGSQRRGVKGSDTSSAGGTAHSAAPTLTTTSDAGIATTSPTPDSATIEGLSTAAELGEDGEGEDASFLLDVEWDSDDNTWRRTLAERLLPMPKKTNVDELSFLFRFWFRPMQGSECVSAFCRFLFLGMNF